VAGAIAAGQYVCVSISNSGPGMDREQMQRAFNPLHRSHSASPVANLALWMVDRCAREAGGYADMESEIGHGATLRIYVPAQTTARPAVTASA
jgi:signal transduction histidine kinase